MCQGILLARLCKYHRASTLPVDRKHHGLDALVDGRQGVGSAAHFITNPPWPVAEHSMSPPVAADDTVPVSIGAACRRSSYQFVIDPSGRKYVWARAVNRSVYSATCFSFDIS